MKKNSNNLFNHILVRLNRNLFIIILLVISNMTLYAQYENLPSLKYPLSTYYTYEQSLKGRFFNINYDDKAFADDAIFGMAMGNVERYRFCQNGTFAITNVDVGKDSRVGFFDTRGRNIGYLGVTVNSDFKSTVSLVSRFLGNTKGYLTLSPNVTTLAASGTLKLNADNKDNLLISGSQVLSQVPFKLQTSNISLLFSSDTDEKDGWIGVSSNHGLHIGTNNSSLFYIDNKQKVYIGATQTMVDRIKEELKNKYSLFVVNGVLSEDYAIAPQSTWSDFVLSEDYNLRKLEEVETFINDYNHLPDVPSAEKVAQEGYSQYEMNRVLLQKIEELTLYTIQQQKEIKILKEELSTLKK